MLLYRVKQWIGELPQLYQAEVVKRTDKQVRFAAHCVATNFCELKSTAWVEFHMSDTPEGALAIFRDHVRQDITKMETALAKLKVLLDVVPQRAERD